MAVKVDYRQELRSRLPELRARYGVKRLFLFGSRARGDARAESDLDLLVEFERVPTLFDLVRLERELADDLGVRVQVVTPGAIKPPLRPAVERDLVEV
ncbi:DNA polymerase beta domain protein region [Oceanithermus profundus DSM 14977]|uniref:DNA polymerase beta domain protein region n=1 Tax=Oceanithermus profundus (strain DSM 14977 / NBRC 100410 / VKM B-2274 / 506) TaxID=670487 RepID=E4U584_OCEP5|nr:nucleotidyltransferase family protein [Oceanithermus profundus]ADR37496.1 DNA polymerase beta domain protein region [Oceanithermus profundus DSM 14977]